MMGLHSLGVGTCPHVGEGLIENLSTYGFFLAIIPVMQAGELSPRSESIDFVSRVMDQDMNQGVY